MNNRENQKLFNTIDDILSETSVDHFKFLEDKKRELDNLLFSDSMNSSTYDKSFLNKPNNFSMSKEKSTEVTNNINTKSFKGKFRGCKF